MENEVRISRKVFIRTMSQGAGALALGGLVHSRATAGSDQTASTESPQLPCHFKQVGQIEAPYARIRDLAFDSQSNLLAAGETGIRILSTQGQQIREIPTASPVQTVTTTPDGALFVGLQKEVLNIDPSGTPQASWTAPGENRKGFNFITSLAFYEDKVFVADAGNRCVYRFASDGDYIDEIDGFHIPSAYFDCVVDTHGILHVAHTSEHRVESYDANGELVGKWGRYGTSPADFCGCCNPTNLNLMPNGWIVTAEKGLPRLKVYDSRGTLQAMLSPEELGLREEQSYLAQIRQATANSLPCHDGWPGMPVAIDKQGLMAVSLPGLKQIRLFEIERV